MARHTRTARKKFVGRCTFCGESCPAALHAHRHLPGTAGGRYEWANVIVACASCHAKIHAGVIVIIGRYLTSAARHLVVWRENGVEREAIEPTVLD